MSLDDDVGADKYGKDLARAIEGVFGAYEQMAPLPDYCVVKKGDILQATARLDRDPIFGKSQIVIIGLKDSSTVIGTSLRKTDKAFLAFGQWGATQFRDELLQYNFWEIKGNIGLGENALSDYFIQQNAPRN